jgi:hypothetical protein
MPQDPIDPVVALLVKSPLTSAQRRAASEAFTSSANADDLQARMVALDLPKSIRADLWDLKETAPNGYTGSREAPPDFRAGFNSSLGRFGSNAGEMLAAIPTGLAKAALDPINTGVSMLQQSADQGSKAKDAYGQGRYWDAAGQALGAIPVIGPGAAEAGEQMASGDVAGGLGKASVLLASAFAPKGAPLAGRAAKATGRLAADTASEVIRNPTAAAIGAIEGYQVAGVPGAIAGGLGAPMGVRGLMRAYAKVEAEQRAADVAAKAAATATKNAEKATAAGWEREAKNLNARDAYVAKKAAQEATDLTTHQRQMERIQQATTKEELAKAKQDWADILQHAKNLTVREKTLAKMAADELAAARQAELFPDGGVAQPPTQRVTSRTTHQGVTTTTSQTMKSAESATPTSAQQFLESIGPRVKQLESNEVASVAADVRELSRKAVLTPAEMQRLEAGMRRMKLSAHEAGMTYPATQSPRRYVRDPQGRLMVNVSKDLP